MKRATPRNATRRPNCLNTGPCDRFVTDSELLDPPMAENPPAHDRRQVANLRHVVKFAEIRSPHRPSPTTTTETYGRRLGRSLSIREPKCGSVHPTNRSRITESYRGRVRVRSDFPWALRLTIRSAAAGDNCERSIDDSKFRPDGAHVAALPTAACDTREHQAEDHLVQLLNGNFELSRDVRATHTLVPKALKDFR